jgi:hypothetical protein
MSVSLTRPGKLKKTTFIKKACFRTKLCKDRNVTSESLIVFSFNQLLKCQLSLLYHIFVVQTKFLRDQIERKINSKSSVKNYQKLHPFLPCVHEMTHILNNGTFGSKQILLAVWPEGPQKKFLKLKKKHIIVLHLQLHVKC